MVHLYLHFLDYYKITINVADKFQQSKGVFLLKLYI
jgi:hypothetical protein